jgi:hypothetical protein
MKLWYVWRKLWTYLAPILTLSPNGPKRDSTRPTSPRSSNGCVQNDFWSYGTFGANHAPILNQGELHMQTNWNKLPFESRHKGVSSSLSKMISEVMVHLTQTVHLSCTETNTISKRTKTSFHLSLVTQDYHPMHPKQFPSLWYVWRKPCTHHAPKLTLSPNGLKGDSTWPTSPMSSIWCVQNNLCATVCLVQTMDLSCTETNTIYKWNHVT